MLPSSPPRDANGKVLEHDHDDILDEDGIIRRIDPNNHVVADPKSETGYRISSLLLKQTGGVSVDLMRPMLEDNVDCEKFVTTPKYLGSIVLEAKALRSASFKIGYDPVPENDPIDLENPYHGLLWGKVSSQKIKELIRNSSWLVPIDGVTL